MLESCVVDYPNWLFQILFIVEYKTEALRQAAFYVVYTKDLLCGAVSKSRGVLVHDHGLWCKVA